MNGHQHVPIILFLHELLQFLPPSVLHDFGNRWLRLNIHQSVRDDGELGMTGRQVEVVDKIAIGIGVAKNPGARIYRKLKDETALVAFASGVHANLHHALPDGAAVAIARKMANGVEHSVLKNSFNRIFDVELVNSSMQFATLLNNCRQVLVQSGNDFAYLYVCDHRSQSPD